MDDEGDQGQWLAVIGRSLAFLCLQQRDVRNKDLLEKADFLEALGLTGGDIPPMLGVEGKSISQARWRASSGKRGKRGKAKKRRG